MEFDEFIDELRVMLTAELPESVAPYDGLYDELGFDSFQAFELLIVVEAMAETLVAPEDVPELFTLGDAHAYFEHLRSARVEAFEP